MANTKGENPKEPGLPSIIFLHSVNEKGAEWRKGCPCVFRLFVLWEERRNSLNPEDTTNE